MLNNNRNYTGPWQRTLSKLCLLSMIRLYQIVLSPFLGGHCRYVPSCSEYAYEAIAKFGIMKGLYLSLHRVWRCKPGSACGYDPVPDTKDSY